MAWTPAEGTVLFNQSETNAYDLTLTYLIEGTSGDGTATSTPASSYDAAWVNNDPVLPANIQLSADTSGVHLVGNPNMIGFAALSIEYMTPERTYETVEAFSELPTPANSPQIIVYNAPPVNRYSRQLTATARNASGSTVSSVIFTVTSVINYTTGRDQLVPAVQARS